jgi:Flp pilus assembly protein TadD
MDATDLERARTLVALDRDEQARVLLARLLADDPHNVQGLCLLAQACLGTKDYPAALRAASAAARAAPEEEWAYRLAALALARLARVSEARGQADIAVRLDPGNWRTHLVRPQIDLIADAVSAVTEAAARQAVRLGPTESHCHRTLGSVLLEQGRPAEAATALREALRLDPQDAAARNDLARVHIRRRNLGRAAADFAAAAALDPADRVAARNLVVVGAKALRVVHLILWVVLISAGRVAADESSDNRAAAGIGFGVAALSLIAFGIVLWRGARPRTWRLIRIILRRDRYLAGWAGCLAVAFVFLGAAAAAPRSAAAGLVGVCFVALLVGVILSWVRGRRRR